MNDDNNYNGWANRENWRVNLWINNEERSYRHWRRVARDLAQNGLSEASIKRLADELQTTLENETSNSCSGRHADLVGTSLACDDWREIAQALILMDDMAHPESDEPLVIYAYTRAQAIARFSSSPIVGEGIPNPPPSSYHTRQIDRNSRKSTTFKSSLTTHSQLSLLLVLDRWRKNRARVRVPHSLSTRRTEMCVTMFPPLPLSDVEYVSFLLLYSCRHGVANKINR